MSYRNLLSLMGLVLIACGIIQRGWYLLVVWLGCNFLVLGIAHGYGWHGVFGKRPDGTLPLWSWVVFLPLHLCNLVVWHVMRILSREPAQSSVSEQLVVSRRLLAFELQEEFDNVVDLTAEFTEPFSIRKLPSYRNFPILDGGAPMPYELRAAVASLRPGRTLIHCAQGHGRTGLFALAVLLDSGVATSIDDGLRMLSIARPAIRLNRDQRKCIELFVQNMRGA